jgi:hypothetical protein
VLDREVVPPPVLAALEVEVVVLLTVATGGLPELPPQPATRTPLMSAEAANKRARGERVSRLGWILSCIWSPCGLPGSAHWFYATSGFRKVSLLETEVAVEVQDLLTRSPERPGSREAGIRAVHQAREAT